MSDIVSEKSACNPFSPPLPADSEVRRFGGLYGVADALMLSQLAAKHDGLVALITSDTSEALRFESELQFFNRGPSDSPLEILPFPDWETLPYDLFSPHQDIIAQRLETLYRLPQAKQGIIILPVSMLGQRVLPQKTLHAASLILDVGAELDLDKMRQQLEASGYRYCSQVMEHGEFTVRGSLLDLFPTGSEYPIRIDLFDKEIESIRLFDPDSQRTIRKTDSIRLLPAREFPFTDEDVKSFRQRFRETFDVDPSKCSIYRDISNRMIPNGIEYYQPLFFDQLETLFDYLPANTLFVQPDNLAETAETFYASITERYEQRRYDIERPVVHPDSLWLSPADMLAQLQSHARVLWQRFEWAGDDSDICNFATGKPPALQVNPRLPDATIQLRQFLQGYTGRVLFVAETEGRREALLELLRGIQINPARLEHWAEFIQHDARHCITVGDLEEGMQLHSPAITIITEPQLFGERIQQRRRRRAVQKDQDAIISNLTELNVGSPVVHQDHGVGRYLGLQKLDFDGQVAEFLTLEYAGGDKLYVPVSSLHLISRYTGASADTAPVHRLGTDQWEKAKKRAARQAHDVAAELLEIYARRAASTGHSCTLTPTEYQMFAAGFPFEETPDQEAAIQAVMDDMCRSQTMDRVVCGDVGFGKTEVAMRAAFIAANSGKQVVVLVPTTLLAQQHYQNFLDRFADWPFRIEVLSRFKSKKEQTVILNGLQDGKVDIVIGTHKLLGSDIRFERLGLLIVDEEHRFGVRQKEKIKSLVANVDLLTLTATPIPRTLNMSLAGIRDLSIIATPPSQRLAVKTFVNQWDNTLIREACERELKRGGQVYFLHNDVESIQRIARELSEIVPDARVEVAHGQMRERELEQVMSDFYHRRFNVLVCTTIVESGIDIPTANTIIINRADKLGLAQLHQLRGRVGRSHHRAYAYLIVPPKGALTADAEKRLEAIESLEELGAGFMLATHDLEIRGAGELLGDGQSGQIQEIGFTLYNELLQRAVSALKSGKQPELDRPLDSGVEIDLHVPALIPDDYLPDVHSRLTLYKRLASCNTNEDLRELQVEMIDRFGLLPDEVKTLVTVTELKLLATPYGIRKIDVSAGGGRILFNAHPNVEPISIIKLLQQHPLIYKLDGADKLRIVKKMPELTDRVETVNNILNELQLTESET